MADLPEYIDPEDDLVTPVFLDEYAKGASKVIVTWEDILREYLNKQRNIAVNDGIVYSDAMKAVDTTYIEENYRHRGKYLIDNATGNVTIYHEV